MATLLACDKCREPITGKRMVVAFYAYGGTEPSPPALDLCPHCWQAFQEMMKDGTPQGRLQRVNDRR